MGRCGEFEEALLEFLGTNERQFLPRPPTRRSPHPNFRQPGNPLPPSLFVPHIYTMVLIIEGGSMLRGV